MARTPTAARDAASPICKRADALASAVEIAFWLATLLPFLLFPTYLSLASQIAITALFALSLDLILGYAGIVSLGHAAFFGIGAYTAGMFSKFGWGEPLTGLLVAARLAAACRLRHQLHHRALSPSGADHDHARPRPAARAKRPTARSWLTGGGDGLAGRRHLAAVRPVSTSISRATPPMAIRWPCCSSVPVRAAADSFAVRPGAARHPRKLSCACRRSARRAARISARSTPSPRPSPAFAGALI